MKIIDKSEPVGNLHEYAVGDFIKSAGGIYLVVENDGEYAIVDLESDNVSRTFDSLEELYDEFHDADDHLVHGELTVTRV